MRKKRTLEQRVGGVLRAALLWPIVGVMAVCGFRIAQVSNPGRIGHMCAETDAFLKERALGLIPPVRPVLLMQRSRAANAALLDLIGQHFTVWDKRWQKLLFTPLTKFDAIRYPLGRPVLGFGEAARYYQINQLWGDRPPVFELPGAMQARGRARLAQMGVPDGAWFVCVHVREGGYSPGDEATHAHRNADIESYRAAIEAVTARGGWVIRMGDPSMRPLPEMAQAVDYALSPHKADWMDLWLCAHTRFMLGSSSGLIMGASLFHRPVVMVNVAPHGSCYGPRPEDLSIIKRLVGPDGAPLPFHKVFGEGLSVQRHAPVFAERGVTWQDNTPDEIAAVVVEMMDRLDGHIEGTAEDEDLQRRFRALLSPLDYAFGASSRLGRDWLRANRDLLIDQAGRLPDA